MCWSLFLSLRIICMLLQQQQHIRICICFILIVIITLVKFNLFSKMILITVQRYGGISSPTIPFKRHFFYRKFGRYALNSIRITDFLLFQPFEEFQQDLPDIINRLQFHPLTGRVRFNDTRTDTGYLDARIMPDKKSRL